MKKRIMIISIIVILLIIIFLLYIYYNPFLCIKLVGKQETVLEVNKEYKELGVKINGTKKKSKIKSNLNTSKIGEYQIVYSITVLKTTKIAKRVVKVVDTTKPTITLTDSDLFIYQNTKYKEPGFLATDNYDGDITNKVVVDSNVDVSKIGEYQINYKVADSSNNIFSISRKVTVKKLPESSEFVDSPIYINGILLVNKKYFLPSNYNPGVDPDANNALQQMQSDANLLGYNLQLKSGFRSYNTQVNLYNYYVSIDGEVIASTYSAKPGQSEHQTGLAFDVGEISNFFGETESGKWLANNCHKYGFIIRYLKNKESITGYKYEPWHIRYVGVEVATEIYNAGLTLEEYLRVD